MKMNPLHAIDFYKGDHRSQYPDGSEEVYSNLTARSNKLAQFIPAGHDNKIVFFGLQYPMQHYLIDSWNRDFFGKDLAPILKKYERRMARGLQLDSFDTDHIKALHLLGYLPIEIKALPEGSRVPIGVPMFTIKNTRKEFFWLTNYLETILSCYTWLSITTATTAFEYKRLLTKYAKLTGTPLDFVKTQAHDFSFRGMSSPQSAVMSGAAHLTSFTGTDIIPAIDFVEDYYFANADKEVVGVSVPATEHSVMCMGGKEDEISTFRRLIHKIYPAGPVSIVSDTWDFWKVVTEFMPLLKEEILNRDGTVVLRPDSGDPVKIICGDATTPYKSPEYMGAIECLWNVFGGTKLETGYKLLDPHIRLIYGDSITLDRAEHIMQQLQAKGFASGNVILGVGSYSYQHKTRDNHGMAIKSTSGVVNGVRRAIFKDPKTDDGTKRSAKGLISVLKDETGYVSLDERTEIEERQGELQTVFYDGRIIRPTSLKQVRELLEKELCL